MGGGGGVEAFYNWTEVVAAQHREGTCSLRNLGPLENGYVNVTTNENTNE